MDVQLYAPQMTEMTETVTWLMVLTYAQLQGGRARGQGGSAGQLHVSYNVKVGNDVDECNAVTGKHGKDMRNRKEEQSKQGATDSVAPQRRWIDNTKYENCLTTHISYSTVCSAGG